MPTKITTDLCIIGAGSGGLSVAAGAAQLGVDVVMIESHKTGGDCLNYGCVPSKALIAAAHIAHDQAHGGRFGVKDHTPEVDMAGVRDHIKSVIGAIEPHDSPARFEELGCKVILAKGSFKSPRVIVAGDYEIHFRYAVVSVGSSANIPPIPGLDSVPFLTNETIFDVGETIRELVVVGGGPIGSEMAQAHARLGAKVRLIDFGKVLPRDDQECIEYVRESMRKDGVIFHQSTKTQSVEYDPATGYKITIADRDGGNEEVLTPSHLLIATGRKPNIDGLNLEAAGIKFDRPGITVDARLRSVSNKRVFAIGDCAGGYQFTHVAGYHAGLVVRNALFAAPTKADYKAVPWCTYTDPEIAHVGMNEDMATKALGADGFTVARWSFEENDRAQAERATNGLVKVIVDKRSRIRGATIVGKHAGELITPWVMATQMQLKMIEMTKFIIPYPTLSEVTKRVAGSYFTPALFAPRTRKIVSFLKRLPF
ncbi:MAG: FAD-dependent oxidoreductase [Actinomycetia bacterium]|nr:FAD-dependent oxidoreductase [Actinomycetes bacterium]